MADKNQFDEPEKDDDIDAQGPSPEDLKELEEEESGTIQCMYCGKEIYEGSTKCPKCGQHLVKAHKPGWLKRIFAWILLIPLLIAILLALYAAFAR